MSFIWTSVRPSTESPPTFLSKLKRELDSMYGLLDEQGFGWMVTSRGLWSVAQSPSGHQWQVVPPGACTGTSVI